MSFTWPLALLSLLLVPALLLLQFVLRRRKRRAAVTFSSVALIRAAVVPRSRWRRILPAALFLAALTSMGVASARPQASVKVPLGRTSIILALDVSRSMCATDVPPNRLTVAQAAARSFVKGQPSGTRIGLVVFAGFAQLAVPPTTDKAALLTAIDGLTTARGTTIGAATLKAIDAIAGVNADVAPIDSGDSGVTNDPGATSSGDGTAPSTSTPKKPGYVPDIVVLLTDGANTQGIEPVEAAKQAVQRGVRVYTIGFGTTNPTDLVCSTEQLGGDALGGAFGGGGFAGGGAGFGGAGGGAGGFGGRRRFLVIDEPTLQQVAKMTGGTYYRAQDAAQLRKVFTNLPKDVVLQSRKTEITVGFAAAGAVLAATALALSMLWNRSP